MSTRSLPPGTSTSRPEVVSISSHGFWLLIGGAEYFVPFERFPWFRNATRTQIRDVEFLHGQHLYWPTLDVDLDLATIEDPDKYPLVYR